MEAKDMIWSIPDAKYEIGGTLKRVLDFVTEKQLLAPDLWKKFVMQFRPGVDDGDHGWRCEYWGKMMRGAAWVYHVTGDESLYSVMETTVRDLLKMQDGAGRISSYSPEGEMDGWDLWGRKYVMLGMQYFSEVCPDEALKAELVESMKRQADAIIAKIGDGEGKKCISEATRHWKGINSCSILEPFVRLYRLTDEQRFFDFATYIVDICENGIAPIFQSAFDNEVDPYEYPVVKAYETMSCFEGLAEYYRVTRDERHRTEVLNFGYRVLQSDVTVIGCCGCTHELFDHSAIRQSDRSLGGSKDDNSLDSVMQETCVSVTLMKFCLQLLRLSGDAVFADCIENSFYNAYLGAVNIKECLTTNGDRAPVACFMPFDSYSPLTAGSRGRKVGGFKVMEDGTFYGCCACISPAGIGMLPAFAFMEDDDGLILNTYFEGTTTLRTPAGRHLKVTEHTAYPFGNTVEIVWNMEKEEKFNLTLRVPAWSRETLVKVNGDTVAVKTGYNSIERVWKNGDRVEITFDSTTRLVAPPEGAVDADKMRAIVRGGIVYAISDELGEDPRAVQDFAVDEDGVLTDVREIPVPEIPYANAALSIARRDGSRVRVVDYASAGKDFKITEFCAWFPIAE